jgi:hypothetical protein
MKSSKTAKEALFLSKVAIALALLAMIIGLVL